MLIGGIGFGFGVSVGLIDVVGCIVSLLGLVIGVGGILGWRIFMLFIVYGYGMGVYLGYDGCLGVGVGLGLGIGGLMKCGSYIGDFLFLLFIWFGLGFIGGNGVFGIVIGLNDGVDRGYGM